MNPTTPFQRTSGSPARGWAVLSIPALYGMIISQLRGRELYAFKWTSRTNKAYVEARPAMQQELFVTPRFDDTLWAILPMQEFRDEWTPPPFANLANQRRWGQDYWSTPGNAADDHWQGIKATTEQEAEDLMAAKQHFQGMYRPVRANPFLFDRHAKSSGRTILHREGDLMLDKVTKSVYYELPATDKLRRMAYDLRYGNMYLTQPPVTRIKIDPTGTEIYRPYGVRLTDLMDYVVIKGIERKWAEYCSTRDDPLYGSNPPRVSKFDSPHAGLYRAPLRALKITFLCFKFGLNPPEHITTATYPYITEWEVMVPNEKEWQQLAGTEFLPNM